MSKKPAPTAISDLQEPLSGLRNSFIRLTKDHRPELWKYCYTLTGNAFDAEDLVQDTLLRAFAKLAYLGQALNPRAYLFRMATNYWLNQHKKKRVQLININYAEDISDPGTEAVDMEELMEWLVVTLAPKQLVVFLLSQSFDFSNKEIADMLETSEGTIKSYLHRARKTLATGIKNSNTNKRPTVSGSRPDSLVVRKYIEAFNRMDAEALLELIDEQASTTITGDWIEFGKEQIKKFSLYYWSLDKVEKWAEYGLLDGIPVIFGYRKNQEGEKCLREIIRLEHDEEKIYSVSWNFFTVDLIKYAAAKLGVACMVEGYQYEVQDV
jgi:RNA polymerase sigma-70 factor (ECF subfamily)